MEKVEKVYCKKEAHTVTHTSILSIYLEEFAKYAAQFPGPISDCVTLTLGSQKTHIVFGALIHGNEVGSLPAVLKTLQRLLTGQIPYKGKVSFFLGNKPAALAGKRFIDQDLNRLFGTFTHEPANPERQRAKQLMSLLATADLFVDFHQTNQYTPHPFYIFGSHDLSNLWAQVLGVAPVLITRKAGLSFSTSGLCSDEWMRQQGKAGLTLELSEQGFRPEAAHTACVVMQRALQAVEKTASGTCDLNDLAKKNTALRILEIMHREPYSHALKKLTPGLHNFERVYAGQVLGEDGPGKPLLCPKDGYILFPKYPIYSEDGLPAQALPGEIFLLVHKIT